MKGKKITIYLDRETAEFIESLGKRRKSSYIRDAIKFYREYGDLFKEFKDKLDAIDAKLNNTHISNEEFNSGNSAQDENNDIKNKLWQIKERG